MTKPFLDTNILLYSISPDDGRRRRALDLVEAGGLVSVQVLTEFADVAWRKLKRSWPEIQGALDVIASLIDEPRPLLPATHRAAVALSIRYGFRIYDSLIVAAAQEAGCATLYTEDLRHGQVIGGLTIVNPFLPA